MNIPLFAQFKKLKPSKCVGHNDIPEFVMKGSSVIFIPTRRHIFSFNLTHQYFSFNLTHQYFPAVWKEAAVVLTN
jgi:hypothetical protein